MDSKHSHVTDPAQSIVFVSAGNGRKILMSRYDVDQQLSSDKVLNVSFVRTLEGYICANLDCRLACIGQKAFDLHSVSQRLVPTKTALSEVVAFHTGMWGSISWTAASTFACKSLMWTKRV